MEPVVLIREIDSRRAVVREAHDGTWTLQTCRLDKDGRLVQEDWVYNDYEEASEAAEAFVGGDEPRLAV